MRLNDEFTVLLENLGKMFASTDYYIAGDFNIDLFSKCNESKELTELLLSVNAYPTIYHPTRVTKTSSTLIDKISTNSFFTMEKWKY